MSCAYMLEIIAPVIYETGKGLRTDTWAVTDVSVKALLANAAAVKSGCKNSDNMLLSLESESGGCAASDLPPLPISPC